MLGNKASSAIAIFLVIIAFFGIYSAVKIADEGITGFAHINPNNAPVLNEGLFDQTLLIGQTIIVFNLNNSFSDPDGDPLVFSIGNQIGKC